MMFMAQQKITLLMIITQLPQNYWKSIEEGFPGQADPATVFKVILVKMVGVESDRNF